VHVELLAGHDVGVPTPIVLLHGFAGTGAAWAPVVDRLGERYRALAPDIRGHGSAAHARPVGFPDCTADVAGLAPPRFALAGYSMGARLALHVALAHPERVSRLVLIGATAGIADPLEREARREEDEALAAEIEEGDIERFADRWERQPLFRGQPPEVVAAARADRLRNRPEGLAAALRGVGTGTMAPLWSRLPELEMATTIVVGERDAKYRKLGERMAAALPDAELLVVPGVGHAVHLEAPGIVAATIAERVPA
jgi:2-succinyl-6-hydroxy-2,4-cyclohexadiene-1-carboxylate synthase